MSQLPPPTPPGQSPRPPGNGSTQETNASESNSSAAPTSGGFTEFLKRSDTWWSVLILLFCFTAGCGLPFLWVSKAFNVPSKIVVSVLVTLYTITILWIFFVIMAWVGSQISGSI